MRVTRGNVGNWPVMARGTQNLHQCLEIHWNVWFIISLTIGFVEFLIIFWNKCKTMFKINWWLKNAVSLNNINGITLPNHTNSYETMNSKKEIEKSLEHDLHKGSKN